MKIKHEEYTVIQCPVCQCREFVYGYQGGYGAVTGDAGMLTGCAIRHQICRRCGTVVRSFVDDPEKLLKRRDRNCGSINI